MESKCEGVAPGTRIHGYFPMSPSIVLQPTSVRGTKFVDGAAHRDGLLAPYLTYSTSEDPRYAGLEDKPDEEDLQTAACALLPPPPAAARARRCACMWLLMLT